MSSALENNYLNVLGQIKKIKNENEITGEITLVAVSKKKPAGDIKTIYDLGQRDFGENTVQEFVRKYDELPKDIRWHFIGHLQTNKVKQIIGKTFLIHSVDSLHLAEEINKEAGKQTIIADILIQVNISDDEKKFGIDKDNTVDLIKKISALPHIRICGLMTIGKNTENIAEIRRYFSDLRKLSIDIKALNIDNVSMDFLSMGMSSDYEPALLEGSNMIRIGTGIFGDRAYL